MKEKIFNLVNLFVSISGEKINDNISLEKNKLMQEIDLTRNKINELNSYLSSKKYFDESLELLDKNTVIALEKKIKNFEYDKNLLKTDIENLIKEQKFINEKNFILPI